MKLLTQSEGLQFVLALSRIENIVARLFKILPLLFLFGSAHASTGMTLNFNVGPHNNSFAPGACDMSNAPGSAIGSSMCSIGSMTTVPDLDNTRFFHGTYTDPDTSASYWHTIVGDPSTGFAMESYIPRVNAYESTSGGKPSRIMGWSTSLEVFSGNGWDPLGIDPSRGFDYTGNATADPTKVIMRQVMGGTWDSVTGDWSCNATDGYCSEFLKDQFLFKPKITQKINESDMVQNFVMDMSTISYSDDTTAGSIINTLTITDPDMPDFAPTAGDFQMIDGLITISRPDSGSSSINTNVTGGRYTYTQCSNLQNSSGVEHCWQTTGWDSTAQDFINWDYEEGTYSYVDGGAADVMNYEWDVYWDPSQNGGIAGNESKCLNGLGANSC
ncbi:MAG TPA: hypothetical protein ENJ32_14420 [Crenotrichaceae bacterium]|nr:hypothetical protein [Crenotrichaceae bacterium]